MAPLSYISAKISESPQFESALFTNTATTHVESQVNVSAYTGEQNELALSAHPIVKRSRIGSLASHWAKKPTMTEGCHPNTAI